MAYLGTTSHGQSVETTMAQIVADTLGVDYDDVTITLEREGIEKFVASLDEVLQRVDEKRRHVTAPP